MDTLKPASENPPPARDSAPGDQQLNIRQLGQQPYEHVWQAMQNFTQQRQTGTCDEIWLLEHPPVFTQGQAGKAEHLLAVNDIPVIQSDRGGQITYHGPGQLICYVLINLKRKQLGARGLVSHLENALIATLASLNIEAFPKTNAPGVYTTTGKIASLGLRIRHGCSFHGLALNVAMDLSPFNQINPCGFADMAMTQIADYLTNPDFSKIQQQLVTELKRELAYTGTSIFYQLPQLAEN